MLPLRDDACELKGDQVFCRNPRGLFEICGRRLQQVQANLTGAAHRIVTQRVQCCYRNRFPPSAANWADVWSATFCEVKPMYHITHRLRCVCVESAFFFIPIQQSTYAFNPVSMINDMMLE